MQDELVDYGEEIGLAEAMFDNDAEWPDELGFRKGDMLRVLDEKPAEGLADGWWLCADQRGRRGIAPANRLRLLHRFQFPENRVITPRRFGDLFLYKENGGGLASDSGLLGPYDIPSSLRHFTLLHDLNHPLHVKPEGYGKEAGRGRQPVVHTVPIRVEGRKSPPPPPQRRYFHVVNSSGTSASSGSETEELKRADPTGLRPADTPLRWTSTVSWRDHSPLLTSTPTLQRASENSTVNLTPPDGSERSSSLSEESSRSSLQDNYDVPPAVPRTYASSETLTSSVNAPAYNLPTTRNNSVLSKSNQDVVALGLSVSEDVYDTPSSLHTRNDEAKDANGDDYDVPRRAPASTVSPSSGSSGFVSEQLPSDLERLSVSSMDSKDSDYQALLDQGRELPLSPGAALNSMASRQQELQSAVTRLCGFPANRHWRSRHVLQENISDIRSSVGQVCRCLDAFLEFSTGALVNLSRNSVNRDSLLPKKLAHVVRPLRDSQGILDGLRRTLGRLGWTLAGLNREGAKSSGNDPLDQFIAVAKEVPEDCRQVAAFIQGNASLIFAEDSDNGTLKRDGSGSGGVGRVVEEHELDSAASSDSESLFDDYDFIDGVNARPAVNGSAPSREDSLTPTAEHQQSSEMSEERRSILRFYSGQVDTHMECLSGAIEDFLTSIEENQPPSAFVGRSKLVILAAHKLVYIGDSISQCLKSSAYADQVKRASDALCQVLKDCVAATKTAAARHPSVSSIQKMVDAMVSVSHVAHDLKLIVRHLATL